MTLLSVYTGISGVYLVFTAYYTLTNSYLFIYLIPSIRLQVKRKRLKMYNSSPHKPILELRRVNCQKKSRCRWTRLAL